MSFWSGQTLLKRAQAEELIDDFDPAAIACSAYELRVGGEAFVTRDKIDQLAEMQQGKTPGHLLPKAGEAIYIPSGQFALLITAERVRIPKDAIGLISIKAGKKWAGLVNVSGFHVDPGWDDKLIFGVFNAGPTPCIIKPGERFFLLFFASLDHPAEKEFVYTDGDYDFSHIPTKLMQQMSGAVPTAYKLNEAVKELREDAKGAQHRSTLALTVAVAAGTFALASITLAVNLATKLMPPGSAPAGAAATAQQAAPAIPSPGLQEEQRTTVAPAQSEPKQQEAVVPPPQPTQQSPSSTSNGKQQVPSTDPKR